MAGREVRLERDVDERDRYGRLLAYVHADGKDVGAELLRHGYAEPLVVPPNVRRAPRFAALARRRARRGRGLWGACALARLPVAAEES